MAEEQAVKPEGASEGAGEAKTEKRKKINKLSLNEINKKIEDLEKVNQVQSKYYKQLVQMKNTFQS